MDVHGATRLLRIRCGTRSVPQSTRLTQKFQLDADADRQHKLTTWIEFLGYEYWWYDQFAAWKKKEKCYQKAWMNFVGSEVLRSLETEDSVRTLDAALQAMAETEKAERAVQSAKVALELVRDVAAKSEASNPRQSGNALEDVQRRLTDAQSNVDVAVKDYNTVERRNDFID